MKIADYNIPEDAWCSAAPSTCFFFGSILGGGDSGGGLLGALPIIGPIISGVGGAIAAGSAADTQSNAANAAAQVQQNMFNTTQANLAPYMGTGGNALNALQIWLGLNPGGNPFNADLTRPFRLSDFTASPSYNFELQQGMDAIQNSAAAKGGLVSGNTLKALQQYGTGLAGQDYWNAQNAFTNWQNNAFNRLYGLVNTGQNAAANVGSFGQNTANQIGNNMINAANAQAAGTVGTANALSGIPGQIQTNFLLQQIAANSGAGGGY